MATPQSSVRYSLGIDVSKADFHVRLLGFAADYREIRSHGKRKFANAPHGFAALVEWLAARREPRAPLAVTMEATGVYHERLAYFLHDGGFAVSIQLPNKVQHYVRSLNEPSKTDDIDAYAIARMGLERRLEPWEAPSAARRELRVLTREHQALNEELTAVKNQRHALQTAAGTPAATLARHGARIALIAEQLAAVERAIAVATVRDEGLRREVALVTSLPGVALKTAAVVLAETDGFALFTSRNQLVKFCGYDIVSKQSGTSVKGRTRISKKGNARVRRALFFPVMSAVRVDGIFRDIYLRTYERTRCKMMAHVAVQRKLLITMMALVKTGQPYRPKYYLEREARRRKGAGRPEGRPAVDADAFAGAPC